LARDNRTGTPLVLDAWPIMEWFRGREPAASAFSSLLTDAARGRISLCMSRMNLGEIYYMTAKAFGHATASALVQQLTVIFIEVVSVTDADVDAAARLKARYALSYADAFAAVLSMNRDAALVTGDSDFQKLLPTESLRIHWLGA